MTSSATATTIGEGRVLAAAGSGGVADLSDLADDQRVVSADTIRDLCVGSVAGGVDARGVRIRHARVIGSLDLSYCTISHPLTFEATAFTRSPNLRCAHLPELTFSDRCLLPALLAESLHIDHKLELSNSIVSGPVELQYASVGSAFRAHGTTFNNAGDDALNADGIDVVGDIFLDGIVAHGSVRLFGAKIGGDVICPQATLVKLRDPAKLEQDPALSFERAKIDGSVFLTSDEAGDFRASGGIVLRGAQIGGDLVCRGAKLTNAEGDALSADRAVVARSVFFDKGFEANGTVWLNGADIGGDLMCNDAAFSAPTGDYAVTARDAKIARSLSFHNATVNGGINLFRASATSLADDLKLDSLGSWKRAAPIVLDGFTYTRFGSESVWDSSVRAHWLTTTADFEQGAWQQLITVYRDQGRDDEATSAAIDMHKDRLRRGGLPWYRAFGRRILGVLIKHGYRPWRAIWWALLVIGAYSVVVHHWSDKFVPATDNVTGSLQPIAYATDTFLPIIELGQGDDWNPVGSMRWADWTVILLGWCLTTIFVAAFTSLVRKE